MHRILAIGAATVLALALSGEAAAWSWPADGAVVRPFVLGTDAYAAGQHRGIDVAGPDGSAVKAPAAGVVTFAGSLPTYGRGVTILTADDYAVTLVHLGTIAVAKGATVGEGDTVGTMGVSGTPEQDGPSVHLGIRPASDEEGYVDPLGLLPPRGTPVSAPSPTSQQVAAPVPEPAPAPVAVPPPPAVEQAQAPAPAAPTVIGTAPAVSATDGSAASQVSVPVSSPGNAAQASVMPVQQAAPHAGVTIAGPGAVTVAPAAGDTAGQPGLDVPAAPFHAGAPAHRLRAMSTQPAPAGTPMPADARAHHAVGRRTHVLRASAMRPEIVPLIGHESGHLPAAPGPASTTSAQSVPPERADLERSAAHAVVRDRPVTVATDVTPSAPRLRHAHEGRNEPPVAIGDVGALVAGIVLLALLAAAVGRQVARRIGIDGAVLRHHTDLLRQLDAAHRPCLHDRGRRRLRSPSATART